MTDNELRKEAAFLLDRLDDLAFDDGTAEEIYGEFAGHVVPSMERLRFILSQTAPDTEGDRKG